MDTPAFVSPTHEAAWRNGEPFIRKDPESGEYVDLNAGLPSYEEWAFANAGPADGEPGRPEDDPTYTAEWEEGGLPPRYAAHLDAMVEGRTDRLLPEDAPAADDLPESFQIVTRSQAREARKRQQEGVMLELPYTGGWARVRILDVMDQTSLGWVPDHLQNKLAKVLDLVENPAKPGDRVFSGSEAFKRLRGTLADTEEIANAFCVRGFIEPRLVATEAEADLAQDEGVMWVGDLNINERITYFHNCLGYEEREARLIDPFRRQPVAPVPHQSRNQKTPKALRVVGAR